jgi:HEAT repeat protein/PBS lyase HEAT-like repeat-containing protein
MRTSARVVWLCGLGVAAALGMASVAQPARQAAAASPATLAVRYDDGHLSVHAERVPLDRVLQEVARQARLELAGVSSLEQDVSVTFADLPLLDGVRRLLRPVNYLLRLERSPQGAIERIEVLLSGQRLTPSPDRVPAQPGTARARRAAVERLGARGDEDAVPHILAALDDVSPEVRHAALVSLSQYGARALEPLHRVLRREPDHAVRLVALQVLAQVPGGTAETVALLSELLGEQDARIRAAVVPALARAGGPRATERLHMAADDAHPEVRLAALQALAWSVRDHAAAATLTHHLADADAAVRGAAAALLETFSR